MARVVGGNTHPFPQTQQKYVYMRNDSHRISTECWQKTLDCWKGRKSPCNQVEKKKKKKRTGWGPGPLGGSCERGKVSAHWEAPSPMGDWLRQTGSFRASEERTLTPASLQQPEQRKSYSDSESYHPALPSVTHVCRCWRGAGCWKLASEISLERGLGDELCRDRWSGWHPAWPCWGFMRRPAWSTLEASCHCLGGAWGEGQNPDCSPFCCAYTKGKTLPTWPPEAVTNLSHHQLRPQVVLGPTSLCPNSGVVVSCFSSHCMPWGTSGQPAIAENPRPGTSHNIWTPPVKEENNQHMLRKEVTGIHSKATLASNILNPHKIHKNVPTYK